MTYTKYVVLQPISQTLIRNIKKGKELMGLHLFAENLPLLQLGCDSTLEE
jgi:hypothetical protein